MFELLHKVKDVDLLKEVFKLQSYNEDIAAAIAAAIIKPDTPAGK